VGLQERENKRNGLLFFCKEEEEMMLWLAGDVGVVHMEEMLFIFKILKLVAADLH
jgi:hypothetical protein